MGLFNRKSMADRQADALKMADKIADGKGFSGRMTKAFMGSEFTDSMKQATSSIHQAGHVSQLVASGVPTRQATVLSIQDTGQTINDNPHVVLTLDVDGQQIAVAALISRLEIPRVGESVKVLNDPASGALLYAGLR